MHDPVRCPACDHLFDAEQASSPKTTLSQSHAAEIASGGENYHSTRSQARRVSPLAKGIRWCSVALVLGAIVAVIYQAASTGESEQPSRVPEVDQQRAQLPTTIGPPKASPSEIMPEAKQAPPVAEPPVELSAVIRRSVVMLETEDADGTSSLGTGFLMQMPPGQESSPVIVTNYHVLSAATSAYARFHDGSRHVVLGYRAIAADMDLAAVELASLPVDAQPLRLAKDELKMRAEVVSIGHPQGIGFSTYPGEVSTVLQSTGLPASARKHLRRTIAGQRDLIWIQHTARISEGNSGGPLLTSRGRVAGVNTWTNHEVGFSYALHARQVGWLLAAPLAELAPLQEYTTRQALATESREQLSAEKLTALFEEVQAFGFIAGSKAQYRKLQELAVAMTYAGKQPEVTENSVRQQEREALVRAADKIAAQLRSNTWDTLGAATLVNDFALEEYRRPLAGVFLFAVVDRVIAGPSKSNGGDSSSGTRGMLLQIAGSSQQIFIPLEGLLIEPEPQTQCLIIGMNFRGQVVRYGNNPLALTEVPVIVTGSDGIIELAR